MSRFQDRHDGISGQVGPLILIACLMLSDDYDKATERTAIFLRRGKHEMDGGWTRGGISGFLYDSELNGR